MPLDTPGIQKLTTIASSEVSFYFFYHMYLQKNIFHWQLPDLELLYNNMSKFKSWRAIIIDAPHINKRPFLARWCWQEPKGCVIFYFKCYAKEGNREKKFHIKVVIDRFAFDI